MMEKKSIISEANPNHEVVFEGLSGDEADIYNLVLAASGISASFQYDMSGISILTRPEDRSAAIEAVSLYLDENRNLFSDRPEFIKKFHATYSGAVVAFLLFILHWRIVNNHDPYIYHTAFGASASDILRGDWYRCITALLLHSGEIHLAGNMAGILVFGTSVCTITGPGVGWTMILFSGFIGNYFNAVFYKSLHLSIGASTAVFGAVGILAGYRMIYELEEKGLKVTALIPIGAGLSLLALLGASPDSDIMAHFFGFAAGFVSGALFRLFNREPMKEKTQLIYLTISATIPILCWVRGNMNL